jgi:parallel beta-helix repeat protein
MKRWWNAMVAVGWGLYLLGVTQHAEAGPTYYVDADIGDDTHTDLEAQNPATPWRTIKKAVDTGGLATMVKTGTPPGYTVIVQPGVYHESVESKRDGFPDAQVVIQASPPGSVTIQPPSGTNGIFISHHYHVIEGFVVTGATIGLKLGPHDPGGTGPVVGVVARDNEVHHNSSNGIQFTNALDGVAESNTVYQNNQNGISYSGNGSVIHDNVVHTNAQFGIYIKDGIDHQLWDNTVYNNGIADLKIQGSVISPPGGQPPGQRTFYVDATAGNDAYDEVKAQSPSTPWKTIRRALQSALAGETVAILPGLYAVTVESMRDGTADAPITIKAVEPGTVTIRPAGGSGVYVGHHYHTVEGLNITAASTGLQMGPYKNTGAEVLGLVARENHVYGNGIGIKFTNVRNGRATHNVIHANGKDGITYAGNNATIFNNLLYGNGTNLSGEYAITLSSGSNHQLINNTVFGNHNGGMRLANSNSVPVFSTVYNNIVVQNPVGMREPAGSDYKGRAILDYNDVYNNSGSNYMLSKGSGSAPGPNSISLDPIFVAPAHGDFRLGRQATGQTADSPAINRGSDTAENLGLGGRTAFTDKYPDLGQVDLGYHETLLRPSQGTLTLDGATLTLGLSDDGFTLSGNLRPGDASDGMEPGVEYVEVEFGGFLFFFPAGDSRVTLDKLADGSVDLTVTGTADFGQFLVPTLGASFRLGDDFASAVVRLGGTLQFP